MVYCPREERKSTEAAYILYARITRSLKLMKVTRATNSRYFSDDIGVIEAHNDNKFYPIVLNRALMYQLLKKR